MPGARATWCSGPFSACTTGATPCTGTSSRPSLSPGASARLRPSAPDATIWTASDGGWLSYRLAVRLGPPQALNVTYWGSDSGRMHDVLVGTRVVGTERFENNRPGEFYDRV